MNDTLLSRTAESLMDVAFQLECINSYVIGTEARAHLDIARLVLADVQKHLFIATASK